MGRGDSDGSAVLHGRPVKRRRDPALRLGVRLGVNGKQVLFPRHPEHGQLISAQQVLAPVAQALLTLGPYDYHDSRARGVSRYLL